MHVSFSARYYNIHPDTHGLGRRSHHVVHSIVGLHAERQWGVGALWRARAFKWNGGEQRGGGWGDKNKDVLLNTSGKISVCLGKYVQTDSLCVHSWGGHSRPPLWPGSKWLLSSWSRVCLQQENVNTAVCSQRVGTISADISSKYRSLTCVIGERPAVVVKDEPTLLPGLYLSAHFDQEASAGFIGDGQVEAGVRAVSSRLDVAVEVKVVFPHWEVAA